MSMHERPRRFTRRWMLRGIVAGTLAGALAGGAGVLLAYLSPKRRPPEGQIRIAAGDLPRAGEQPSYLPDHHLYLVALLPDEGLPMPARPITITYPLDAQTAPTAGILVVSDRCPAEGCRVMWREDYDHAGIRGWFRCPCRGHLYTKAGIYTFGPGTERRSLSTHLAQFGRDGSLTVTISETMAGGPDNALRLSRRPR